MTTLPCPCATTFAALALAAGCSSSDPTGGEPAPQPPRISQVEVPGRRLTVEQAMGVSPGPELVRAMELRTTIPLFIDMLQPFPVGLASRAIAVPTGQFVPADDRQGREPLCEPGEYAGVARADAARLAPIPAEHAELVCIAFLRSADDPEKPAASNAAAIP